MQLLWPAAGWDSPPPLHACCLLNFNSQPARAYPMELNGCAGWLHGCMAGPGPARSRPPGPAPSRMSAVDIDLTPYVEQYWAQGWCVVPHVFTHGEADALAAELMQICGRESRQFIEQHGALQNDFMTDVGADGTTTPRKTANVFHKSPLFERLTTDGRLRSVARAMLNRRADGGGAGGRAAQLFSDQAFMKGPRVGGLKPVHQDNYYFGIESSDDVITCWTALDDTDTDNGCMRLVRSTSELLSPGPASPDPTEL
jgi:hypothetical protein